MGGQPPVVWDRAVGCNVYDKWGNKWLDFLPALLLRTQDTATLKSECNHRNYPPWMMHSYCFTTEARGSENVFRK